MDEKAHFSEYGLPQPNTTSRKAHAGRPPVPEPRNGRVNLRALFWGLATLVLLGWLCLKDNSGPLGELLANYNQQLVPEADVTWEEASRGWIDTMASGDDKKVKLEAHIMSKCPDALSCLSLLLVPTMANVSQKVDFTLSYIGHASPHSDDITCMHGPSECLGNIVELCAAKLYPDPKIYLGFTLCLSREYHEIPSRRLIEGCAAEHGVDFGRLNECASRDDGAYGMELLRGSVLHSADVGAGTSCTVRLEEKVRCVRDGGEWKDCPGGSGVKDLVGDIEEIWEKKNGKEKD